MTRLHRHILGQVTIATLFALALFVFVLLAGSMKRDLLDLLASGRLSWALGGRTLVTLLPYLVAYGLPFGFLAAVLLVLGRMSANREIVAMKAVGISLYRIAAPIFFLALLATGLLTLINAQYAPAAKTAYRAALTNILREAPLQYIQPRTFIKDFPGYILYVGERESERVRDLWVWELDAQQRARIFLRAKEGLFRFDEATQALVITLKDAEAELRNANAPEDFSRPIYTVSYAETEIQLPLEKILGGEGTRRKLSMLTLAELLERRAELKAQPPSPEQQAEVIRVQFAAQKNFALAFSVLSFAALGIPLGIKASRSETYANLALAFAVAIAYFVAMVLVGFLEDNPAARPDLLIWLPNLFLQTVGLYLLVRANQH